MLDDQELRTLHEIENGVARDDPALARCFRYAWADARPVPVVFLLCVGLYVATPLVSLIFGWPGLAVLATVFLCALTVALARRSRRRATG